MSYHIEGDESVERGVQRCAREQLTKAIDELRDDSLDRAETVHQVRKRMKKLRGLVRLVRPALGDQYKPLNKQFRDIARQFSDSRDADVMIETFDKTIEHSSIERASDKFAPIRAALTGRREQVARRMDDMPELIGKTVNELSAARDRVSRWALNETGFDAVSGGLAKTYKRARDTMADALDNSTPAAFHEWRKRVKYHRYHVRLLERAWPRAFKARWQTLRELTDLLGDDHDLVVLNQTVRQSDDRLAEPLIERFLTESEPRRRVLESEAAVLGVKLFTEKPKHLLDRFEACWTSWRTPEAIWQA